MRPLELLLEGFTSFRREQRLDFSELDLFAITGATGAGKSSLLDAMTFALYGTTARTGKQVSDLVSQGATNLKVQLRFAVGGSQYRVTRRWRYRASSPENKVLLEGWQNSEWETLGTSTVAVQKTLEQILGMDFDTFTRVIVLPQGKFDEFLKGDTAKRREILRSLAGFEIFERMRKEAAELAKLLKQEREMLERRLAELDAPAFAEVDEKQAQLTLLEQEMPTFNQAVLNAQKALDEFERIFTQITRLKTLQQQLANLNIKSSEIEALQVRLDRAQAASHLEKDWALVQEARASFTNSEDTVRTTSAGLTQVQSKLSDQQHQLEKVRAHNNAVLPQLKAREDALAAAKAYEEQRTLLAKEVAMAQATLQEKTRFLQAAQKQAKAADAQVQNTNRQRTEARALLAQHSPGGERLEQLNKIAPLLIEYQVIEKQVNTQQKQLAKATQDQETVERTYEAAGLNLTETQGYLQQIRATLEAAEQTNAEAALLDRAAGLRMLLKPGDPCPVCGSEHPEVENLPPVPAVTVVDIAPLRGREAGAQRALQEAQMAATKAEAALEAHKQKALDLAQTLAETQQRSSALQEQISAVIGVEEWQAKQLVQEQEALQTGDVKYRQAEQQLQKACAEVESAQQALQFAQQTEITTQTEYQTATAEVDRRQQQLQSIAAKLYELTDNQPYETLASNLAQQQQELASRLKVAEASYQTAYNNFIQLEERAKQANIAFERAGEKQQQLNAEWQEKLSRASFTEETFLAADAGTKEQSQWELAIREHRESKLQLETRIKDLTEVIGNRMTDEGEIAELSKMISQYRSAKLAAEDNVKQAQNRRAELSAWIQVAEQKLEETERLLTQQSNLAEHEETYHTLAQNLKSNEFQAYILEHLEDELVTRATLLLRELTENRYALTIQDGEYWVEDNWNGGELRRVRTLSGGETFATSLSMALALSEKLSQGAQLGSLFLDEGFGTLDGETLETVTQILESLRQQSRLIGVITHVRALAERLPTQIKVYKSPQGSRIEVETQ
ncbi:AAA family ATPase [Microcoleus sp. FACHB-672]|uniref:AAA family ATPase n=1 Tax=Microcoleus sp. FACHB-672 TaxID=2692825 RepID=UPI001689F06F|nr:SMC family ATPase [Microcoleus sp. FACHB-672]MBD2041074.1 SMC family ATPase [Microcoleus sp. FACHB-672]